MADSLEPSTTAASVMAKVCMVMGTPSGMGMEICAITAMTAANRPRVADIAHRELTGLIHGKKSLL